MTTEKIFKISRTCIKNDDFISSLNNYNYEVNKLQKIEIKVKVIYLFFVIKSLMHKYTYIYVCMNIHM